MRAVLSWIVLCTDARRVAETNPLKSGIGAGLFLGYRSMLLRRLVIIELAQLEFF